ncbi:38586_t:CDS:2, partial [Gigaspora margarita]
RGKAKEDAATQVVNIYYIDLEQVEVTKSGPNISKFVNIYYIDLERGEATTSGPRIDDTVTQEMALSTDEREFYDKLDIKMKKVFLESITKAREVGIREGIEKERKKGKFFTNVLLAFPAIFAAVIFDVLNVFYKNEDAVQIFVFILNALIYGLQMVWSAILTVRESPRNCTRNYYVSTFVPLLLGILLPAILIFVCITPTVALGWTGVGVLCSNLSRDFFNVVIE